MKPIKKELADKSGLELARICAAAALDTAEEGPPRWTSRRRRREALAHLALEKPGQ